MDSKPGATDSLELVASIVVFLVLAIVGEIIALILKGSRLAIQSR